MLQHKLHLVTLVFLVLLFPVGAADRFLCLCKLGQRDNTTIHAQAHTTNQNDSDRHQNKRTFSEMSSVSCRNSVTCIVSVTRTRNDKHTRHHTVGQISAASFSSRVPSALCGPMNAAKKRLLSPRKKYPHKNRCAYRDRPCETRSAHPCPWLAVSLR